MLKRFALTALLLSASAANAADVRNIDLGPPLRKRNAFGDSGNVLNGFFDENLIIKKGSSSFYSASVKWNSMEYILFN